MPRGSSVIGIATALAMAMGIFFFLNGAGDIAGEMAGTAATAETAGTNG